MGLGGHQGAEANSRRSETMAMGIANASYSQYVTFRFPRPPMYTLLATIPEFRRQAAISNWRRALPVLGPGYLVAVGYVDPGNWATDIAAGAKFGYALLFVVAMSSIVAAFLQMLTVRLALATGTDLATMIRDRLPRP